MSNRWPSKQIFVDPPPSDHSIDAGRGPGSGGSYRSISATRARAAAKTSLLYTGCRSTGQTDGRTPDRYNRRLQHTTRPVPITLRWPWPIPNHTSIPTLQSIVFAQRPLKFTTTHENFPSPTTQQRVDGRPFLRRIRIKHIVDEWTLWLPSKWKTNWFV